MNHTYEWLETDGLGGFASGTVSGRRSRRYHALLLTAATPPSGRFVLVNGFDACVETSAGRYAISSQHYSPDVVHPDGERRLVNFDAELWPKWTYQLEDGTLLEQEVLAERDSNRVLLRWRLVNPTDKIDKVSLIVRPFFSGRDYHALHRENSYFRFEPRAQNGRLLWRPYDGVPATAISSNAQYKHDPLWYRNFLYVEERARGLDCIEDLASPGEFRFDLISGDAMWLLEALPSISSKDAKAAPIDEAAAGLLSRELSRRASFPSPVYRAADAYIVRRGNGTTIVAGYPWFTDWGRDTFIAIRGLCLATGRLDDASDILLGWADTVSEGMLPNRFPDHGELPEYNSVDASLWYVVAVHDFLEACRRTGRNVETEVQDRLRATMDQILVGYSRGTRYGIHLDTDGLLAAGTTGVQLTWMDAKVGDWVVTPRIGKPVEVQALWLNALWIASAFLPQWRSHLERGRASFQQRFWNEQAGHLYDVVDCDHRPGTCDASLRPNQILAVGGLPYGLLDEEKARRVVDRVEHTLVTPIGLRSLAPSDSNYKARYWGGLSERDGAYHQGTVWPWLLGPFVEAWIRVRGATIDAKRTARQQFVEPLLKHLQEAGLGHISEIADAEAPHNPRGCPFQAWSLSELLRLEHVVLAYELPAENTDTSDLSDPSMEIALSKASAAISSTEKKRTKHPTKDVKPNPRSRRQKPR